MTCRVSVLQKGYTLHVCMEHFMLGGDKAEDVSGAVPED